MVEPSHLTDAAKSSLTGDQTPLAPTLANVAEATPAHEAGSNVGFSSDPRRNLQDEAEFTPPAGHNEIELPPPNLADTLEPAIDAPRARLRGSVDQISDSKLLGWVMIDDEPSRRCVVALQEHGVTLARATASRYRPDLEAAGLGDGCYAFEIDMPRPLLDGEEHALDVIEQETGLSFIKEAVLWRSTARTGEFALTGNPAIKAPQAKPAAQGQAMRTALRPLAQPLVEGRSRASATPDHTILRSIETRMIFDISDLVYYIGHHPNLTGIQRVQSSIVLSIVKGGLLPHEAISFISFDARSRNWVIVPTGFLISLLEDLFLPEPQRLVAFSAEAARVGLLPGAKPFDGTGMLDAGCPSVLCLLGAAWVQRDYFHRILSFKRRFGTRFVMMIHDLIPIYARETCDQGTARVFEEFLRRAVRHVDHYLSVSHNTANDLRRYFASSGLAEPSVTVTGNGSSFHEFLGNIADPSEREAEDIPDRFVLFVATIEGRKNHQLILDIWRRMIADGDDVPHLVCVGRIGWKSHQFVSDLVETNYLGNKVILLQDVSDESLDLLYRRCMFTLCPSLYEGWGLPIGESLAAGKICVCSDRSSLPEVAGEFGVYLDIGNPERSRAVIRDLIADDVKREELEAKIRRDYVPTRWQSVAQIIVETCDAAARTGWQDGYPDPMIPYASEVSFSWVGRDEDSTFGDDMLNRITHARRGHFLREPLHEHSFLLGEDSRASGVWAEPESWGTWLCHSGGEIAFSLPASDSQLFYVFLRLHANGLVADLNARIVANGESAWDGKLGVQPRDIVLRVRRRATRANGSWRLRIRLEIDLPADVIDDILGLDNRGPTVGLERLVVCPETDLKTRLDVLYTLLL